MNPDCVVPQAALFLPVGCGKAVGGEAGEEEGWPACKGQGIFVDGG